MFVDCFRDPVSARGASRRSLFKFPKPSRMLRTFEFNEVHACVILEVVKYIFAFVRTKYGETGRPCRSQAFSGGGLHSFWSDRSNGPKCLV